MGFNIMAQIQIQNLVQPKFINGDWRQPTLTLKGKKWCAPPIVVVVTLQSQNRQNCPELVQKFSEMFECCLTVVSKLPQKSQSCLKVIPKLSQSVLKVVSTLSHSCSKVVPKFFQCCPEIFSKLFKSDVNVVLKF